MKTLLKNSINSVRLLSAFRKNPYLFFDLIKPSHPLQIEKRQMGIRTFYFCYHPDHVKHILHENKENYPKSNLVLKKILPLSGPKGLIQLSDQEAKVVRQIAGRLMHPERSLRLSEYVEGFVKEKFDFFDRAAETKSVIDLKPFLTQLVLRTAGVFILDMDIQSQTDRLNHAFVELNRMAGESLQSLITPPFSFRRSRHLGVIHGELDKIIQERIGCDGVSLLHELYKNKFPKSFIRDQIKAFMFAGYDTTASSLIFAVDSIARSQSVQDKIYAERKYNYRLAQYTQAAYKESLRLYPSAYFLPRQARSCDTISGQKITAGSQIFISIRHVHRNDELYINPNSFIPERFLETPPPSYAYLPFGGGARICIGAPLALMEATVVLQKLCERYRIYSANQAPPEIEGLITAHTKSPLFVRLDRRPIC